LDTKDFTALRISLASPERVKSWSYGEVTKPETINYRRLRPEKDGLFCEAIFGPTKDWQCYCGKYKNVRYKGIVCDKCGVEVTRSSVRRERMGHIDLAAPVAHIWYTRRVPSYLGVLLDVSRRHLDRVLYFAEYVITEVNEDARQRALLRLDEEQKRERKRLDDTAKEQNDAIEAQLAEEKTPLESELEAGRGRREEQRNQEAEKVLQEAKALQSRLEREQDKKASASVSLTFSDQVIVSEGEEVTREHLTLLKDLVQERLSQIEAELAGEQARDEALIQVEKERLSQAADERTAELQAQFSADEDALQVRIGDAREELRNLSPMQFLNEVQYRDLKSRWGQVFKAGMGAEAFYGILQRMDLEELSKELWPEVRSTRSKQRQQRATKRLRVAEALRNSENRPEWMILTVLPVIPPDLRPMVQLDGGRFATSDLNDLYRRVINRNNRLKRLLELDAPDVIIRNEKRMLQEAVDSLIDNSRRGKALSRRGRRELKSLSDMLKGKKGRFRRNLLGKRVDYSGRSVIVIGPELKLHQCGLPKSMALELYRPFVIAKLVEYNYASNVKGSKRFIERERPEVWEVLEEVIRERPVLLNRAPTLHRLGIQAFEPVLVEGKAIQIHPLVCAAFNADFDGDQMAVHVPLSHQAVEEARKLMLSTRNLLLPASGEPIVGPTKDMVLGCFYLTMEREGCKGEGMVFGDIDEVELAYSLGKVDLHARIKVHTRTRYTLSGERYSDGRARRRIIETTAGRALFNQILPGELRYVNEVLDKGRLKTLVASCHRLLGLEATGNLVDRIKSIGFQYATRSGASIAVSDFTVPKAKDEILHRISEQVNEVDRQYRRGLLTEDEQYARTIELWTQATDQVTDAVAEALDPNGSIYIMAQSGSTKGGFQPIRQLAGMRGLMADPAGRIIALPIRSNFREGLTALEYFISTHGARKGLADTALRTADAGYLTRRLVDVAQDVIINAEDCGTRSGIWVRASDNVGGQSLGERIIGRIAAGPVVDPNTGEILVNRGEMIEEEQVEAIEAAGVQEVYVRSPLTCQMHYGLCAKCYGRDLGRGELVEVGAAVGIVAAQSIGEPGTQLTLRTFHTGGVAGTADITHGLPRVEELFEARKRPKGEAIISDIDGIVEVRKVEGVRLLKVVDSQVLRNEHDIKIGWKILVEDGDEIADGTAIASRGKKTIVVPYGGRILREERHIIVLRERRDEREYEIPSAARLIVENGQRVKAGQQLTEGSKNPHRILSILGREATQLYLLQEVQQVYRSQGVNINDKHFEVIIRKMLNKVQVTKPGDTDLLPGEWVDRLVFAETNAKAVEQGGRPASARPVLLGVTKAALNTESFLSAASFQHTIKVLAGAAIEGKCDHLRGLKENVIIGKKIPAGTGFRGRPGEVEMHLTSDTFEGVGLAILESIESGEIVAEEELLDEDLEEEVELSMAAS
jgi:DNA-directed RNA polymerase subunit beta'